MEVQLGVTGAREPLLERQGGQEGTGSTPGHQQLDSTERRAGQGVAGMVRVVLGLLRVVMVGRRGSTVLLRMVGHQLLLEVLPGLVLLH